MTEEEYNSMSAKEQEAYENYLRPTDKEIAELDAYYNLFGGYLREYVEVKEKEENWLSKWKEHKDDEDEDTYWEIEWNNELIENKGINRIEIELKSIIEQCAKNPSKELIERKIKRLEVKFNEFHNGLADCIKFILTYIEDENLYNLGHTEAWIYLDKYLEKLEGKEESFKRKSKTLSTPKWIKGDIERLIKQMKVEGFISKDYNEESIKDCFSGKPIKEIKPIEFINGIHNSTKAQLMHHIDKANLISKSTQEEKAYIIGINKNDYKNALSRQKEGVKITHIQELKRVVWSVTSLL